MTEDENEPLVKQPQKAPKYQELVNTNRDDSVTKDEQKPVVKQSPKSPKMPELVDTHSHTQTMISLWLIIFGFIKGRHCPGTC